MDISFSFHYNFIQYKWTTRYHTMGKVPAATKIKQVKG